MSCVVFAVGPEGEGGGAGAEEEAGEVGGDVLDENEFAGCHSVSFFPCLAVVSR